MEKHINWDATEEFLKKENVKLRIESDYSCFKEHGAIITLPDGDMVGCSPRELKQTHTEAMSYGVAKAFRLLSVFKKKGYVESIDCQ